MRPRTLADTVGAMSSRLSLTPGVVLGKRYRLERQLAQGGMGAVFEARHVTTEMRLAVKVLWPEVLEQAGARQRFELEARVAARVASPHIVKVLDAGFAEDGELPYLVMELLDGEDLRTLVQRSGPLEPARALLLLEQVAAGLDAAHAHRAANGTPQPIVHRDLKPENLFVTDADSDRPFVRILDFGIAKVLGDTSHVSTDLKGTPLYMAPEQIRAQRVSPETDVWALGLVAYYLVTGKVYWKGAYGENPNLLAVLGEIGSADRTAPSERIREQGLTGSVPASFDAWLLRCLEARPERRFSTASEAVGALGAALEGFVVDVVRAAPSARVSGHSATALAEPAPGTPTEKSLAPVQSAPLEPKKRSRRLLVSAAAGAGLVAVFVLASRPAVTSESDAAAPAAPLPESAAPAPAAQSTTDAPNATPTPAAPNAERAPTVEPVLPSASASASAAPEPNHAPTTAAPRGRPPARAGRAPVSAPSAASPPTKGAAPAPKTAETRATASPPSQPQKPATVDAFDLR